MVRKIFALSCLIMTMAGLAINLYVYPHFGELFSYFTLQSNVLCLLSFLLIVLAPDTRPEIILRGCAITAITLTFLVYHFLLRSPDMALSNLGNMKVLSDFFNHYLVPAAAICNYFFLCPKGQFSRRHPLIWLLYPAMYIIYVHIYSFCGGTFIVSGEIRPMPYFFLDAEQVGSPAVALWILIIAAAFFILSCIYVAADRIISGRRHALR
ncbi:MAG: Pr6Pr family membrane protein [Spirochaetia bacterium]|nr:Pr6Pr family membrane protein [Spirochaetia bacterium]